VAGLSIYVWFFIDRVHPSAWYLNTLAYLAAGLLLFAAYHGWQIFVNQAWLRWVGKNSYAIYLWHYILVYPFTSLLQLFPTSIVNILYVMTSIAVGFFSTVTVERYFLNLRKRIIP
jgi:peptidoglycan/LPS O-acetylase OafA/YrhL